MLYKYYYYTVLLSGAHTWKNAKAPVEVDNVPHCAILHWNLLIFFKTGSFFATNKNDKRRKKNKNHYENWLKTSNRLQLRLSLKSIQNQSIFLMHSIDKSLSAFYIRLCTCVSVCVCVFSFEWPYFRLLHFRLHWFGMYVDLSIVMLFPKSR